jgi:hypothetical protein
MPRKTKLDTSWRLPAMRKCEAPIKVGKARRCGKPFRVVGVKKTCSPECSHRLALEWRKKNYRKNAAKIIAAQRHRWLAKPRECAVCKEIFQPIKNSKACLKCREEFRRSQAHQYYLDHPENWERSNAKRTERERAERIPTMRRCVVCGKTLIVKHPDTRSITCSPECRDARIRHTERVRYAADIEKSRAKRRANAKKRYWRNPEKARAQQNERYHTKKASRAA